MAEHFDPYYTWLGIPPEEQPPDHYRLLGVRRFETNDDAVANAADQRMAYVRTFQAGKRSKQSQALLNEIAAARGCLLDPQRRPGYDAALRQRLAADEALTDSVAVLPLDDLPPVLPRAHPLAEPPHAAPPPVALPGVWAPPADPDPQAPLASGPHSSGPAPTSAGGLPQLAVEPSAARSSRSRRQTVSLPLAILIGGGTFALGLVALIATLLWAASR